MNNYDKSLLRLHSMGDWLEMKSKFSPKQLIKEIAPFKDQWKPYNLRNPNTS